MVRIILKELPQDMALGREEMKKVFGGSLSPTTLTTTSQDLNNPSISTKTWPVNYLSPGGSQEVIIDDLSPCNTMRSV